MKKIIALLAYTLLTLAVVQLASCKKIIDRYFPGHPGSKTNCVITKVTQTVDQYTRNGWIYNNAHGNPDSVHFDEGLARAKNHYFFYDNQQRLIAYNSYYNDNDFDLYFEKHTYVYNGNRIVIDTNRILQAGAATVVSLLEYDNHGRVIKESRTWIEADGQPINEVLDSIVYNYDADGNLSLPSGDNYDDKTSYLRTSLTWMFIHRNYSVNNPIVATGYNSNGLPLGFNSASSPGVFLQLSDPKNIEYSCK